MRYEIDENNAVRIFHDGETVPFIYQPDYPNLDKFDTREEAEEWAKLAIVALSEDSLLHAPIGKNLKGEPKVIKEAIQ